MRFSRSIWSLVGVIALAGAMASPVRADATAEATETVVVHADRAVPACQGMPVDEARRFAQDAEKSGFNRLAAECFRAAGDHARADRAQVRASADTGAASSVKVAATVAAAKKQAKQLRAAWNGSRPSR